MKQALHSLHLKLRLLLIITLSGACVACGGGDEPAASRVPDLAAKKTYLHEPDIQALVGRALAPDGRGLDPALERQIAHASPYLGDFFGIQSLQPVTAQQVLDDFVPRHAALVRQDANTLTLAFKGGWRATFYLDTALKVFGQTVPVDHVLIGAPDDRAFMSRVEEFRQIVLGDGKASRYLYRNIDYPLEAQTEQLRPRLQCRPVDADPALTRFASATDAVLLVDDIHGNEARYEELARYLKTADYDWFALEMMSAALQPAVDAYTTAPAGSAAFEEAKAALVAYYGRQWNDKFANAGPAADNPYLRLIDLARQRGKQVRALEAVDSLFFLFRYGESDWGAAVRNKGWADQVPLRGRGIVFGGTSHFVSAQPGAFQDFLRLRDAGRTVVSLRPLTVPQGSCGAIPAP